MVSSKKKKAALANTNHHTPPLVSSSLALRKILPPCAPCRQRYNDAFHAFQKANSAKQRTVKQRQKMGEQTMAAHPTPINEEELMQLKRNLANYRERWRTEELNEAYKQLRRIVPSMPSDKMSKIHTLRIAADYIRFLDQAQNNLIKFWTCKKGQHRRQSTYHSLDSCWTTVLICSSSSSTFEVSPSSTTTTIEHVRANFNAWRAELAASTICQQRQQSEHTKRDLPKNEFESINH